MATHQSASMMAWVYRIVLWLALPLVWVRLQLRGRREPAYAQRQAERFGDVPGSVRADCIWFHTVSAGETIAAAPLIRMLAEEFSDTPFLVTTMTPTGSEQVLARLADCVDHCYAPYDFAFAVKRFFEHVRPRALILMETELWPNLIAQAHARGIPVLLVNARLSARSARGYARVAGLSRPMLERLSGIACQSDAHAQRFVELGADPATTQALGSVKYDVELPDLFAENVEEMRGAFAIGDRPVWIAASTHPGEDELVLQAFARVRATVPEVCLLLVPRHPVRAEHVCDLVRGQGLSVCTQSECAGVASQQATDVVVGDVMGTLLTLYGLADVAFVGGSLVELGGHNPLEPALCRIPVLSGPHQFNFADVMQELEVHDGLVTVHTVDELAQRVCGFMQDPSACRLAGAAAAAVLDENRGATARVAQLLRARIGASAAASLQ